MSPPLRSSSPSSSLLSLRQRLTPKSRIFNFAHHANPSIRVGSNPFKCLLFTSPPSQLTGRRNRSFHEFTRLASSSDGSNGADPSIVSINEPNLDDIRTVIALPLSHKPLISGFSMTICVKDPKLLEALQESIKGQAPYAGAFLLKDDDNASSMDASKSENVIDKWKGKEKSETKGKKLKGNSSSSHTESENVIEKWKGIETKGKKLKGKEEMLKRLHKVGTLVQILSIQDKLVSLVGHRRIRITEMVINFSVSLSKAKKVSEGPLTVKVDHLKDKPYDKEDDIIKKTYFEVTSILKGVLETASLWRDRAQTYTKDIGDFNCQHLADFGAGISGANKQQHQRVLKELNVHKRLKLTLELVKEHGEINKKQETDDESSLSENIRKRIDSIKCKIPKHVLKVIEEELEKLKRSEYSYFGDSDLTYDHLDWLTMLPWGKSSFERFDVLHAKKVLDEDHYGLSDVKERILEFIAVEGLRGTRGKIICLCGPPGVGKTSIGCSIARALGRKFFRFSVGGLSDVAEIKGHRQIYVGAKPGKLVQCLKSVGTENPLILIDEIDKLGKSNEGDPASALLEVMDPEQNANFLDHFLNVPIDLSKVLFVCTANEIDKIPGPLVDRMEVINLPGYITDEKMHIAKDYLVKTSCRDCGIKPEQVDVSDAALLSLIDNYCREAGVRNLQKHIEKIYRKIALKLVRQGPVSIDVTDSKSVAEPDSEVMKRMKLAGIMKILESAKEPETKQSVEVAKTVEKVTIDESNLVDPKEPETKQSVVEVPKTVIIDESNLADYVGKPVFYAEKMYEQTPIGVVMGLAWTSMGGSTLYIETTFVEEGESGLHITGQLGDVMKESAEIAYTVARRIMIEKEAENQFFENSKLHLHVPQGAIPKDGPSAGCAMITSMLSLAMKKLVRKDLAMTGEVSLTGRILPIGGVKEKTMAAKRSQVKMIVFPEANRTDFDELTENVKEGIDARFVDDYQQIFELAFGEN